MSKQNASYQEFADMVQAELQTSTQFWEPQYARYAQELTRKKHQISIARKSFRVLEPLSCYITIGEVTAGSQTAFDLRFLGQFPRKRPATARNTSSTLWALLQMTIGVRGGWHSSSAPFTGRCPDSRIYSPASGSIWWKAPCFQSWKKTAGPKKR